MSPLTSACKYHTVTYLSGSGGGGVQRKAKGKGKGKGKDRPRYKLNVHVRYVQATEDTRGRYSGYLCFIMSVCR